MHIIIHIHTYIHLTSAQVNELHMTQQNLLSTATVFFKRLGETLTVSHTL